MSYEVTFTTDKPISDAVLLDIGGHVLGYDPKTELYWTRVTPTTVRVDAYDCVDFRAALRCYGYTYSDDGPSDEVLAEVPEIMF